MSSNIVDSSRYRYNQSIDVLKIVATIIVFLCHSYIVCHSLYGFEFKDDCYFILKTPAWAAVWIFMVISGYNAYNSFIKKYELKSNDIFRYYKGRFVGIIVPTWIMISVTYILVCPQMLNANDMIQFLTLTYRGHGGGTGIGATWYCFTVFGLYLITPLFIKIITSLPIHNKRNLTTIVTVFIISGLLYRLGGGCSD